MNVRRGWIVGAVAAALVAGALGPAPAQAQWAVIDVASIKQLMVQIEYWSQQIEGMEAQLGQLKKTHAALTGGRGMQHLLPTAEAERNYLPRDWEEMRRALDGRSAEYGELTAAVRAAMTARAVLDDARLATLDEAGRARLLEARQSAAAATVTAQRAFANAGRRFSALESLVEAIGDAPDAKAIEELGARIAAEQAMLGNEQAKLAMLQQAQQAERWAAEATMREAVIAGHGRFAERLHPVLP